MVQHSSKFEYCQISCLNCHNITQQTIQKYVIWSYSLLFSSEINDQESSESGSGSGSGGTGSGEWRGHCFHCNDLVHPLLSSEEEDDEDPREAPLVKRGTCERRKQKSCNKKKEIKVLCNSGEMPDPCSCNPCQKCPSGTKAFRRSKSRYSGFKCLRFSACPTSKGNETETAVSEMNTVELVATIAKNATKLIAERIIKAMQSILRKEDNDK